MTPSLALPAPRSLAWPQLNAALLTAIGLMAASLLLRLPSFGDPAIHVDEEFYLLVGDRMLHGAVPFVDIWDRKPIGLFLIYAAIRLLGGDGIVQYQVVAALFAGGTAAIIAAVARRAAGTFGGIVAGLVYLLWIETVEGGGGQSPVFYNLFMAGAGWCVLTALGTADRARFRALAYGAMALGGLAIQVKYTAVFESLYFGLVLAWATLRRSASLIAATAEGAALAATALAPTLLAMTTYACLGQFRAFWFANFLSVFLRGGAPVGELHVRMVEMALHIGPFAFCATASAWQLRGEVATRRWQLFLGGWLIAAMAGYFSIGVLNCHYMLPLFVPFSIAASPIFRRWPLGKALAGLMLWMPFSHLGYPDFAATRVSQAKIARLAALIPSDVDRGCLHMFAGPPILYELTHACFVSPYIFPDHLVGAIETGAIGVDQVAETRRIMAARPRAIVSDDTPRFMNFASARALQTERDRFYRHAGRVVIDEYRYDVWVRR